MTNQATKVIEERRINIPELNTLRFIFMLMIFFHHMKHSTMFPPGGTLAVTFFFVLSGFSMTIGYRDRILKRGFSYSNYICKRLFKFYPIHWLTLIVSILLLLLGSRAEFSDNLFLPKLVSNVFLVQSFIPDREFYMAFNGPSWYLCNTLFYCFLFPFIIKGICKSSRLVKDIILLVVIVVYIFLVLFVPKEYHHAILYVNPFVRLLDFVIGIYTGLFFLNFANQDLKNTERKSAIGWSIMVVSCFVMVVFLSFYNLDQFFKTYIARFYWILFCPMILAVSLISIRSTNMTTGGGIFRVRSVLRKAGTYSFTFYMIHLCCINIMNILCEKIGVGLWIQVLVTFAFTMFASVICQRYFVEPVSKYLINKIKR